MIMYMFGLKDRIKGFAPPIPFVTDTLEEAIDLAKRDFYERYCSNTTVHYAADDFELWELGTYDTGSGTFIQNPKEIKCIMKGSDFIGKDNSKIPKTV